LEASRDPGGFKSSLLDMASAHYISDAQPYQITATQFAVDRNVKHGTISKTMLSV
jgi:hypothetical protein